MHIRYVATCMPTSESRISDTESAAVSLVDDNIPQISTRKFSLVQSLHGTMSLLTWLAYLIMC